MYETIVVSFDGSNSALKDSLRHLELNSFPKTNIHLLAIVPTDVVNLGPELGVDLPAEYPAESYPGFAAPVVVKSHQTGRVGWPFAGAVDLIEQNGDWVQRHRIQGWRHTGTWCSREKQFSPLDQHGFDLDTYKILVKPIMLGSAKVELV